MKNNNTTLNDFTSQNQTQSQGDNEQDEETPEYSTSKAYKNDNRNTKNDFEFVEGLIEDEIGSTIAESTAKRYKGSIRQFTRHLQVEESSILTANVKDVRSFLKKCAEINLRQSTLNVSYSAIKKAYFLIRTETKYSSKMDLIELDGLQINNYRTPPAFERKHLTSNEIEKLCEELNTRGELMVKVGLETGARNIDITKITRDRTDLENQEIVLTDTKNSDTYEARISETLSIKLRQWIEVKRLSFLRADNSEYLFPKKNGVKMTSSCFTEIVKSAAENAGIQEELCEVKYNGKHRQIFRNKIDKKTYYKVTPHALRHSLNVLLQEEGLDIEGRAAALNQDSIDVNREYSKENTEYKDVLKDLFK